MRHLIKTLVFTLALAVALPAHAIKNDYYRNGLNDQLFRGTAFTFPTQLYIDLYTVANCPTAATAGTGTPYSGNGYAAITCTASTAGSACNPSTSNWDASASGATQNSNALEFPTVTTADWTSLGCVAIRSATNILYSGTLAGSPQTVSVGSTASFAIGALDITEAMNDAPGLDMIAAFFGIPVEDVSVGDVLAFASAYSDPTASGWGSYGECDASVPFYGEFPDHLCVTLHTFPKFVN